MEFTSAVPNLVKTVRQLNCPKCDAVCVEDLDWCIDATFDDAAKQSIEIDSFCKHCDSGNKYTVHRTGVITHGFCKPQGLMGLMLVKQPDTEVYLVVEKLFLYYSDKEEPQYDLSNWINVHTCPVNWLDGVVLIAENGDPDPHGVFEFVRGISYADIKKLHDMDRQQFIKRIGASRENLLTIFPEIVNGVQSPLDPEGPGA